MTPLLSSLQGFEGELGGSFTENPLLKERLKRNACAAFKGDLEILPGGLLEKLGPENISQSIPEGPVANASSHHVENHGRFAIPDGLGRRIISALELRKREVVPGIHKGREVPQDLKPVLTALFFGDFFLCRDSRRGRS